MGNSNGIKGVTAIPTKEAVTEAQLLPILATLQTLGPLISRPQFDVEYPAKADGGAMTAIGLAIIAACSRLEAIFADSARYSFADTSKLFETMQKTQEAQLAFLLAQKAAAEEVMRPSFQLKPTLGIAENRYFVYWGDPQSEGGSIVGTGNTIAEAMADFDAAFHRAPNDQVFKISASADAPKAEPSDSAETPEEFQKNTKRKKK